MATAVSVNLLLPLAVLVLALLYARLGSVWLGAAVMTAGITTGLAVRYLQDWTVAGLVNAFPPVLAAAAVGYAVVGTAAVLAVKGRPCVRGETRENSFG